MSYRQNTSWTCPECGHSHDISVLVYPGYPATREEPGDPGSIEYEEPTHCESQAGPDEDPCPYVEGFSPEALAKVIAEIEAGPSLDDRPDAHDTFDPFDPFDPF